MFVGKVKTLPNSKAPESFFTQVGSGLTRKHWTKPERHAREKRSSLLQTFVNYGQNFYKTEP